MTNSKREKEKQQELCDIFISFVRNEGFIEKVDKVRNFAPNMPLFYKRVSEEVFLVFNIPTFGNIKKFGFVADFWKVFAKSESDFLNAKMEDKKIIGLRLSFNLEDDLNLYKDELLKY